MDEGSIWYKTRRTEPFVIPVTIFKADKKYVYPYSRPGSQTQRQLRAGIETCYFKTKDEAQCYVRKQQGKNDGNQNRGNRSSTR